MSDGILDVDNPISTSVVDETAGVSPWGRLAMKSRIPTLVASLMLLAFCGCNFEPSEPGGNRPRKNVTFLTAALVPSLAPEVAEIKSNRQPAVSIPSSDEIEAFLSLNDEIVGISLGLYGDFDRKILDRATARVRECFGDAGKNPAGLHRLIVARDVLTAVRTDIHDSIWADTAAAESVKERTEATNSDPRCTAILNFRDQETVADLASHIWRGEPSDIASAAFLREQRSYEASTSPIFARQVDDVGVTTLIELGESHVHNELHHAFEVVRDAVKEAVAAVGASDAERSLVVVRDQRARIKEAKRRVELAVARFEDRKADFGLLPRGVQASIVLAWKRLKAGAENPEAYAATIRKYGFGVKKLDGVVSASLTQQ